MSFKLGLTGSIGMGKSTTAKMFADLGCAVWDADAAVHRLYGVGGAAVPLFEAQFPEVVVDGQVSRAALRSLIQNDPTVLGTIEQIVHPLVKSDRDAFVASADSDILVFDIPLLFETSGNSEMDAVVCVTVSPELQEKRVLDRGTMSRQQFEQIRAKQMPNAEKVARSDYIVETTTLESARTQVQEIVAQIKRRLAHA